MSTSPRLKATRYGTQSGKTNRSDKSPRRMSCAFRTMSLLLPNRCPISHLAAKLSCVIRLAVSALTGISPPFAIITMKLRAKPRPNIQNPGCLRLIQAKANKINWLEIRPNGTTPSGILLHRECIRKAMICPTKAIGTNQIPFKLGT